MTTRNARGIKATPPNAQPVRSYVTAAADGEAIQYTIMVWPVIYDSSPQGYAVQRPPLEMYIVTCANLPELKKECAAAAARYEGKADTIVTSGFTTSYGEEKNEPKVRGLQQFWDSGPYKSKKLLGSWYDHADNCTL